VPASAGTGVEVPLLWRSAAIDADLRALIRRMSDNARIATGTALWQCPRPAAVRRAGTCHDAPSSRHPWSAENPACNRAPRPAHWPSAASDSQFPNSLSGDARPDRHGRTRGSPVGAGGRGAADRDPLEGGEHALVLVGRRRRLGRGNLKRRARLSAAAGRRRRAAATGCLQGPPDWAEGRGTRP